MLQLKGWLMKKVDGPREWAEKSIENSLGSNEQLKEKALFYFNKIYVGSDDYRFVEDIFRYLDRSNIKEYPPVFNSIVWYAIIGDLFRKTLVDIYENKYYFNDASKQKLDEFKSQRFMPLMEIAKKILFQKETLDVLGDNIEEHQTMFEASKVEYNEKLKEIYKDYFNCDLFLLSVSNKNKKERVVNQEEAKKAIEENKEIR